MAEAKLALHTAPCIGQIDQPAHVHSSEPFGVSLELNGTELEAVDNTVIDDCLDHGRVCPLGSL